MPFLLDQHSSAYHGGDTCWLEGDNRGYKSPLVRRTTCKLELELKVGPLFALPGGISYVTPLNAVYLCLRTNLTAFLFSHFMPDIMWFTLILNCISLD